MRECFRMKKLSNFSHSNDWGRDSNNYVAKRYMDHTDREIHFQVGSIFEEISLQATFVRNFARLEV